MDSNGREQEREIQALIRRFPTTEKSGDVRRKTLTKLIDLTHEGNSNFKTLAAENIPKLLNDFPDLEEDAINAVYDLCEDQAASVRKAGYNAITAVSKAASKWVRRNTDVLLQLLQSDEPDEVVVVKKALLGHLELDAAVTLSVLCDQIMPATSETTDADELNMRARLRGLVLAFLEEDVTKAVAEKQGGAEDALVETLLAAIPTLPTEDINVVVKRLLLRLPSFGPQSPRSNTLVQTLVELTKSHFKTELKQHASLVATRFYMDLVVYLVVEKALGSPVELLHLYFPTIVSKRTLPELSAVDQSYVICNLAETLAASEKDTKSRGSSQLVLLRNQSVDASPTIFECIAKTGLTDVRVVNACKTLLEGCRRRKASGWTVPSNFQTSLGLLRAKAEQDKNNDLQELIRSITAPPPPPPVQDKPQQNGSKPTTTNAQVRSGPSRPQGAPPPPVALMRSRPLGTNPVASTSAAAVSEPSWRNSSSSLVLNENKHSIPADSSPRPPKRLRTESDTTPSLLTRLGDAGSKAGPKVRGRAADERSVSAAARMDGDQAPGGGFSIKGAAKASSSSMTVRPAAKPTSLLDRITMNDSGGGRPTAKNKRW